MASEEGGNGIRSEGREGGEGFWSPGGSSTLFDSMSGAATVGRCSLVPLASDGERWPPRALRRARFANRTPREPIRPSPIVRVGTREKGYFAQNAHTAEIPL